MVAKITQGKNVGGMLQYNDRKVKGDEALILAYNKISTGGKDIDKLGLTAKKESFERLGNLKPNLKNKYIHISLNPNPNDSLSDEQLAIIAKDYMKELGYASQPYIIYKHQDIDRTHVHIVSCNVKSNGKAINDSNLFRRSNEIRKELEKRHNLTMGAVREQKDYAKPIPLDYGNSDIKAQIRSKSLSTLSMIKFSRFEHYKAYMASLNINVELIRAKDSGELIGSTYQALGSRGEVKGLPLRASDIERTGQLHIKKILGAFESAAAEKKEMQPRFESKLCAYLKGNSVDAKSKLAQESNIIFLKSAGREEAFVDVATGVYYAKADLSVETQEMLNGRVNHEVIGQRDQTSEILNQVSGGALGIVTGITDALTGGVGEQSSEGTTDKSLGRRKRRRKDL